MTLPPLNLPIAPAKLAGVARSFCISHHPSFIFGDASPSLSTQPWLRRSSILPPVFPYCSTRVLIPVSIGIGTTMTSLVTLVFRHPHMRTHRFLRRNDYVVNLSESTVRSQLREKDSARSRVLGATEIDTKRSKVHT